MRKLFAIFGLLIYLPATAEEKTDSRTLITDFAILCETSKMAAVLQKNKALEIADLTERISSMLEIGLRSKEVKTARAGISQAAVKDRKGLWEKTAQDVGIKNWKCPTIGNL